MCKRMVRLVGDLIKARGQTLRFVRPDQNLEMCSTLLTSNDIARVPVVSDTGSLLGILSERDIRIAVSIPYFHASYLSPVETVEKLRKFTAEDVMNQNPVCVSTETPITDVIKLMLMRNVSGIPILCSETSKVEGVCTKNDLLAHLLEILEKED